MTTRADWLLVCATRGDALTLSADDLVALLHEKGAVFVRICYQHEEAALPGVTAYSVEGWSVHPGEPGITPFDKDYWPEPV